MTGYQETLTDPSYHRQVVVMTAPHIGNTGMNDEDPESSRIWVAGYVVRDPARVPSSWRSRRSLDDALRDQGVVGISGIDTRALTRHLRERGAMRVGISSTETDPEALLARVLRVRRRWPAPTCRRRCPPRRPYVVPAVGERRFTVAALDLGIKANTPRMMAERGIESHVLPATATLDDVLAVEPDGLFFSNGPGDPAATTAQVDAAAGRAGARAALLRHLLRQPALRPGARLRHLQAEVRPPRHQPAGAWTAPPARSRSPRTTTGSPCDAPAGRADHDAVRRRHGQPRLPQRRRGRGPRAALGRRAT